MSTRFRRRSPVTAATIDATRHRERFHLTGDATKTLSSYLTLLDPLRPSQYLQRLLLAHSLPPPHPLRLRAGIPIPHKACLRLSDPWHPSRICSRVKTICQIFEQLQQDSIPRTFGGCEPVSSTYGLYSTLSLCIICHKTWNNVIHEVDKTLRAGIG